MFMLLALLAQTPSELPPDEASDLEPLLKTWGERNFLALVRQRSPDAHPSARIVAQPSARWGPDAILQGETSCEVFSHGDPEHHGLTQAEINAARARLGPGWASLSTGFTGPGVMGYFDANVERAFRHEDFTVSVTRLPTGMDAARLFDSGISHGCTLSKFSDAWMWSGDLLVRVTGPCADVNAFAGWTLLVMDALPGWSGVPVSEPFVYAACGRMGMPWRTRADLEPGSP